MPGRAFVPGSRRARRHVWNHSQPLLQALWTAALVARIAERLRARGVVRLEATVNPHALEFYGAVGFVECGVAETDFGPARRMVLALR
jgi:hypothetical protein